MFLSSCQLLMKLLASSEEMQIHEITFCAGKLMRGILNFAITLLFFCLYCYSSRKSLSGLSSKWQRWLLPENHYNLKLLCNFVMLLSCHRGYMVSSIVKKAGAVCILWELSCWEHVRELKQRQVKVSRTTGLISRMLHSSKLIQSKS